jgi:hypothetical protein
VDGHTADAAAGTEPANADTAGTDTAGTIRLLLTLREQPI